jgi:hypothetical protein
LYDGMNASPIDDDDDDDDARRTRPPPFVPNAPRPFIPRTASSIPMSPPAMTCAERSPPSARMLHSNAFTRTSASKFKFRSIHRTFLVNSGSFHTKRWRGGVQRRQVELKGVEGGD